MSQLPIILITLAVVLAGGLGIFFWWRTLYGVWAQDRAEKAKRTGERRSTVTGWDDGVSSATGGPWDATSRGAMGLGAAHAAGSGSRSGHGQHTDPDARHMPDPGGHSVHSPEGHGSGHHSGHNSDHSSHGSFDSGCHSGSDGGFDGGGGGDGGGGDGDGGGGGGD